MLHSSPQPKKLSSLSIIKNEQQYFAYCDELERLELVDNKTQLLQDRAELLLLLIEKWDNEHYAIPDLEPMQYLKSLMDGNGLKSIDLQNKLDINKTTLSHILNYRRSFSKKNIRLLSDFFKVSQDAFNRPYKLKNVAANVLKRKRAAAQS
ncbi:MAG: helix-turn-helix domain-containing protein [Bacteroidota bacterium]